LRQLGDPAPRLGPWDPQRLSDEIRRMKKGVSCPVSLPDVLPADLEKQQVLDVIEKGLAAGEQWKTIAIQLTNSGLKPPRGPRFTPVQVRLLYLRGRGLTS
jgi:hypothetical protein